MANDLSVKVLGATSVEKALENIRLSVQRRILRSAMAFAVKPVKPAEQRAAPSRLGVLKRSIGIRIKKYKSSVFAAIGPLAKYKEISQPTFPFADGEGVTPRINKPAKYIHLVEGGTRPHFIPAPGWGKNAKITRKQALTKLMGRAPGWQHPGAKAEPFIDQTATATSSTVKDRFAQQVLKRVRIEWEKARTKNKKFYATDTTGFGQ